MDADQTTVPAAAEFSLDRPPRTQTPPLPGAPRTQHRVALAVLAFGIGCDLLTTNDAPAGIGATLTVLLLLALFLLLRRDRDLRPPTPRWGLVLAIAVLALTWTIRASPYAIGAAGIVAVAAAILLGARVVGRRLMQLRLAEYLLIAVEVLVLPAIRVVHAVRGSIGAIATTDHAEADDSFRARHGRDIVVGIAVAVPLLVLFSALLASADAGFEELVSKVFAWDAGEVLLHAATIALAALAGGAFLLHALVAVPTEPQDERPVEWAGAAFVWIVLGSTIALFALFVLLQAGYLFGGSGYLERTSGLSAADYARRGFYELLTVAVLVVPLLLTIRRVTAHDAGARRAVSITSPVLAALTVLLQASALARMWIYQDRFGLSEERVLVIFILLWVAACLAWLGVRIARGQETLLVGFGAASAIVATVAFVAIDPAATSASSNLRREDGRPDITYLLELGPDAVPAIVANLEEAPRAYRSTIAAELLDRWEDPRVRDWRGWSVARWRAERAVAGDVERLRRIAGEEPAA